MTKSHADTAPRNAFDLDLDPSPPSLNLPETSPTVSAGSFGAMTQTLYLTEAGDKTPISMNDIHQGQIGDCFLVSPMGDLAATHPNLVQSMIHANADGSETVTLHLAQNGSLAMPGATAFKTMTTTVTNVFPTYSVNNGAISGRRRLAKGDLGAGAGESGRPTRRRLQQHRRGGNPAMAMQELTGHTAYAYNPASMTAAVLQTFATAGDLITFDTKNSSALGDNLVGNHAYMFNGVVNTAAGSAVSLVQSVGLQPADAGPDLAAFQDVRRGRYRQDVLTPTAWPTRTR